MPQVSIIIPVYNHAQELEGCLKSILNQTSQDYEIIIVNDGSTDNLNQVLEKNRDKNKIKLINQEHQGAAVAKNRGAKEARGEYLFFCDADLILNPEIIKKMVETLNCHLEVSYAYCSFKFGGKKFKDWPFDPEKLKQMNYISNNSLVRCEHFPGFDEKLKKFQDWDLWLTMLEQGHRGIWIPEILFQARTKKGGISKWLPSIFYKIPWHKLGIKIKALEEYKYWEKIIKEKHGLD